MTTNNPLISVIIPVHNEEARLPHCLDEFVSYATKSPLKIEVIISEDGSKDRTLAIANEYSAKYDFIKVVSARTRLGKGGGILNGIEAARGEIILYMDVDLAVTPDQIPRLTTEIQKGADVVIGSRTHPRSIVHFPPFHRILLGRVFNALVRLLFQLSYFDTQVGFKAFKREALLKVINNVNTDGFTFDADLVIKADKMGYKIREAPVTWSHMRGSTISPMRHAFRMFFDLLRVRLELFMHESFRTLSGKECKEFYDRISGDVYWKAEKSLFLPRKIWHHHRINEIINEAPSTANHILDIGSGSGNIALKLARTHAKSQITGVDIGRGFVTFSAKNTKQLKVGNLGFIEGSANTLPVRDGATDLAILSEVLEYLPNPKIALNEVNRTLLPSGYLILTTPYAGLRWSIIRFVWTLVRKEKLEIPYFPLNLSRLRYLLLETGFLPVKTKVINLGCILIIVAKKVEEA